MIHPEQVLFQGERPFPVLPACEHYAGNEKFIRKAFALQSELGPVFDVTCDCEDGAPAGGERDHARLVARLLNSPENLHRRAGARVHDPGHAAFHQDVEVLLAEAGERLAYLTIPKPLNARQAADAAGHVRQRSGALGLRAPPPLHFIIETQSALRDVFAIAALPGLEALDFGLLDFVSDHRGAIPGSAMRSPGQFEHRLVARAKSEVAAAALANGLVPTHNPCLTLSDAAAAGEDARRAREEFGFLRMYSIHPDQIGVIVTAMRPPAQEVTHAADILLAAQTASWGPVSFRGEMHDRASYRYFWDLLKRARATGAVMPAEAGRRFFQPSDEEKIQ
jgi:citrate lyase subunit beta/citryl-CoA lyase